MRAWRSTGWGWDAVAAAGAAAGLMLAFPPFGAWPLAWIAPAPLVARAARAAPRRAFCIGLLWGALFFTASLYWVESVLVRYGGLPAWLALGPLALLVLYCSAYFALFLWSLAAGIRRWGAGAVWAAPVLWTALELMRGRIPCGGFPWALLGTSQQGFRPALQPAAWGGVYVVGSLIVLSWVWLARLACPEIGRSRRAALALAGALVAAGLFGAGEARVRRLQALPADLRVACLQVNVPQAIQGSPARRLEILAAHRDLTREAAARGARLLVWPESSLPVAAGEPVPGDGGAEPIETWVGERARESGVDILWGGTAVVEEGDEPGLRNSAYLTRADGVTPTRYDKMQLVPFGEYVPLQGVLRFVEPLVREVGDFHPGGGPVLHPARAATLGTVICYEILFPHLVRRVAAGGADVLVTITNDAWYGRSVMPYLHLAAAPLRAVENGLAVVRAANTGISALVDPSGRVLASSRLEERTVLVGDVPSRGVSTFYRRHGDVWAWACAIMTAAYLVTLSPKFTRRSGKKPNAPSGGGF